MVTHWAENRSWDKVPSCREGFSLPDSSLSLPKAPLTPPCQHQPPAIWNGVESAGNHRDATTSQLVILRSGARAQA